MLALELFCSLYVAKFDQPPPALYDWMPDRGWGLRPGFAGIAYRAHVEVNSAGWRDRERTLDRPDNTKRVICLGDSRTFGFGVSGKATFAARLEARLPEAAGGDWEVWNAGVPGHTAYQGARALENDLANVNPDLVVVSFGYNDRRYVAQPQWVDSPEHFASFARGNRIREFVLHLGAGHILFNAMQTIQRRWLESSPPSPTELEPRVDRETYIQELTHIVELCRSRDIAVVLLLLPEWLKVRAVNEKALDELERGNTEEAVRLFAGNLSAIKTSHSLLALVELIEIGREMGIDPIIEDQERSYVFSISTHGAERIRHDRDYRRAATEMAGSLGVPCVDTTPLLDGMSGVFLDECHFNARGHIEVAEALLPVVLEALGEPTPDEQDDGTS